MKLGVSHQRLDDLNNERFDFLKGLGIEAIEVRLLSREATRERLADVVAKVQKAGFELHEIMLEDLYNCTSIALGLPGWEDDLSFFKGFIRNLGDLGVAHTTYAWHTGGIYETHRDLTRGKTTRGFSKSIADSAPLVFDRTFAADELWENYRKFIEQVLPVAETCGVKLQLHPNDPPMDHQGIPRIFSSTESFRRAMALSDNNPYSGILFCVGTWAEMTGPSHAGENIAQAIREFGSRGHVFQVHMRNISAPLPDFVETFPDGGYVDLYDIMEALVEIGFDGMIVPDHVPGKDEEIMVNEAYSLGYLRALIQFAERRA